jgi:hypothetical protein
LRQFNGRLLVDGEDMSDLETLPLLRVVEGVGEAIGTPQPDKQFVPPCLFVSASPFLREIGRALASQLLASRDELALQLKQAAFNFDNINVAGTNAGANFGDPGNCGWTFCWNLTVDPGCAPGSDLTVTVNTTGDGESGSWASPGCADR